MNNNIEKVTAFITQERNGANSLLVFRHPTAGIQIPAGSVEVGEDIETAVIRETYEETGLRDVKIEKYLGCFENELDQQQRIITNTTVVYIKPNLNAVPTRINSPEDSLSIIILPKKISHTFRTLNMNTTDFTNLYVLTITLQDGC